MPKNTITNTSSEVHRDPILSAAKALVGGGIEGMEARGQGEFVESDRLPSKMQSYDDEKVEDVLTSWGFVLGKHVGGDTLFRQAKLPPGWKKVATNHAMHSDIVDEQGRKRCSIFYKAAFYDRSAFLNLVPRYRIDLEYQNDFDGPVRPIVKDGNTVIFTGEWVDTSKGPEPSYKIREATRRVASDWFEAQGLPERLVEQWARP